MQILQKSHVMLTNANAIIILLRIGFLLALRIHKEIKTKKLKNIAFLYSILKSCESAVYNCAAGINKKWNNCIT